MALEYRKIATIQAEQFDGSDVMVRVNSIEVARISTHRDPFINITRAKYYINTLEGKMELKVGDWIATGIDGEQWAISDDIFKRTYEPVRKTSFTIGQGVPVGIPQMADDILDNMGERVCEEIDYDLAGNYLTNIPEEDIEDLNNVITNWIVAKGYSPNYYLCEHAEVITIDE